MLAMHGYPSTYASASLAVVTQQTTDNHATGYPSNLLPTLLLSLSVRLEDSPTATARCKRIKENAAVDARNSLRSNGHDPSGSPFGRGTAMWKLVFTLLVALALVLLTAHNAE